MRLVASGFNILASSTKQTNQEPMIKLIHRIEESIVALLLVAMTLLVFADVVMRFGWGTGFLWSQELTLNLSAWFVLFGISYGLRVGAHIGVDAVVRLLPDRPRRIATLLAIFFCLVYCALFVYGGSVYLFKMYQLGIGMEDLKLPQWLVANLSEETLAFWSIDAEDPLFPLWASQSIIVIGMLLFAVRLVELFWLVVTGQQVGFHQTTEADESLQLAKGLADELELEQSRK